MLYLKNLIYHPTASPTAILKAINLQLAPQQMGLIVGPSGSGKSTLLEILAGLAHKTAGQICWRDQDLTPEALRQLGGLVFQFPERHFCGHTVLEELRLGHPELNSEKIHQALEAVGLGPSTAPSSPARPQRRTATTIGIGRAADPATVFALARRTYSRTRLVNAATVGELISQA